MLKVIGIGRISTDLELKATQSNINFVNFNLAVDGAYKTDNTYFHKMIAWRQLSENLVQFCKKGSKIYVEGHLTERQYDSDNGTKYITEVVCDHIEFLEPKKQEKEEVKDEPFNDEQYKQVKRGLDELSKKPDTKEAYYEASKALAAEEDLPF